MKILLSVQKLHQASSSRGIGVYTRELVSSLGKAYPKDQVIVSSDPVAKLTGDILHYTYFDPFFLSFTPSNKMPVILTIHDLIPLRFPSHFKVGWRGRFAWIIQKWRAQRAAHIITDSESSKLDITKYMGIADNKITVIPLGPNRTPSVPQNLAKKIAKSYNLPEKYLLYVGDINWSKNVPGLIRSFGELKDKDLHLILVGKALGDKPNIPEYQEIESAIAASGKAKYIHTLGYVPSHHLSVLYSRATLYVQPSWYEGFGLPILEAMKFGAPVACSAKGSLTEVGGDAVAYFDPKKDMTSVIEQLLRRAPERTRLKEAGLQRAKEFTWEKTAKATYAVYEKIRSNHL